jgi:endonuclease YncB( thermonuclease family)
MRVLIILACLLATVSGQAASVDIVDGDTIKLDGTTYRLDGIDAPERDQTCLDEKGAVWPCGIEAASRLAELIAKGAVTCEDKGPDPVYPKRRIGICSVDGASVNQTLVLEGWAISFEPYARGRFDQEQANARDNRRGIWKGCFAAPRDFRRWNKRTAKLLGPTCPTVGNDTAELNKLFPDDPAMPTGCPIKGKVAVRALLTGHRGIYHLEGCRSYRTLKNPNRWFCSQEEAQAAGFRKAYTCR